MVGDSGLTNEPSYSILINLDYFKNKQINHSSDKLLQLEFTGSITENLCQHDANMISRLGGV